jgi:hypothetical protein
VGGMVAVVIGNAERTYDENDIMKQNRIAVSE